MQSPVAAAKPPLDWKEPALSPLHKPPPSSCSLSLSPNNNTSSSGSSNGNVNGNGGVLPGAAAVKTIPRSDANPYPTTFVQADTTSFKQVVQMLTGSTETAAKAASSPRPTAADLASPRPQPPTPQRHPNHQQQQHFHHYHHQQQQQQPPPIPSMKNSAIPTGPKRPAFKLYERRHNSFKNLRINPLVPGLFNGVVLSSGLGGSASNPNSPTFSRNSATTPTPTGFSPRYKPEILSPSILDFPSLALSPVTPLSPDPFNRPPTSASSTPLSSAEDRAIAEKGFYLHPSPRSSLGVEPPRLLPLFPVRSPRVAASASGAGPDSLA